MTMPESADTWRRWLRKDGWLNEWVTSVNEKDGSIVEKLETRILGRFTSRKVINPTTGEVIVPENTYLTEQLVDKTLGEEFEINVTFPKEYHEEKSGN